MDSGRLLFDSPSTSSSRSRLILLGSAKSVFQGLKSAVAGSTEEGGASKIRPFFTSKDEIYEGFLPEKKRRLTSVQIGMLERSFEEENKLEPERKSELAKKLGLQPRQVAVWFQNRRARWKNKQVERDFDRLKASYDALLIDHDALIKDNDHLRSQVNLLLEKLQENEKEASELNRLNPADQAVSSTGDLLMPLSIHQKVEDLLSTGSGGNASAGKPESRLPVEPFLPECHHSVGLHCEDDMSDKGYNDHCPDGVFTGHHHKLLLLQQQQQHEEAQLIQWLDRVESILLH
ncbi:homeobox-leucine zipper protein HOX16-like [Curcuma longa]|uniref:homeobox-leucine zipper protein HOX16-like n=1 Tax=Curcuma longa TaxID=136217 RepID=UPI003D9F2336